MAGDPSLGDPGFGAARPDAGAAHPTPKPRPARAVGSVAHLGWRFLTSLPPVPPTRAGRRWAQQWLTPGEAAIWQGLSAADRRHSIGVARRAIRLLQHAAPGDDVPRPVVAAALLHDSGKAVSGLGTFARVGATLLVAWKGRETVAAWELEAGSNTAWARTKQRVGAYTNHPALGEAELARIGSDPLVWQWAGDHHRPPHRWRVPKRFGDALKAADGD